MAFILAPLLIQYKINQCAGCLFRIFFKRPMPGVFTNNSRGVRRDNFDLAPEDFSIRRGAPDRQSRECAMAESFRSIDSWSASGL
jgi:hypothetical protein